ncbi:hypothetical protein [Clostridium sp. YIM B02551]|uniref:hypothetical protein n=1 Tax=Clostridium sp. YIM B02551 TaxID=2910679 RepID=UPI001EEB8F63|nr:hypothetical protein [Clostridium sp. YIM B02551]
MKKIDVNRAMQLSIIIILAIGMELKIFSVISNDQLIVCDVVLASIYIIFLIIRWVKKKNK